MSEPSRLAILPGTFDPFTNGHLDVLVRSLRLFDRVVVAVLVNPGKSPLFGVDERMAMIAEATAGLPGVEVASFDGLLAGYVRQRGAVAVVRGLRGPGEFADEQPVALMNRHLNDACDTVFLVPSADRLFVAARLVREIASLGGPIDDLVPAPVAARLRARFAEGRR